MADQAPWETPQPQQQEDTPPWGTPPQAAAPREGGLLQAPFELLKTIPQFIGALETPEGRSRLLSSTYDATLKPILEHKPIFEGMTPEEETEAGVFGATLMLGGARPFLRGAKPLVAPVQDAIKETVTEPSAQRLETFARTGSPNGVPIEPPLPGTKPSPIQPIQGSPNPEMRRMAAAQTGVPEVDAILNHPTIQAAIDNPVVDRSHTIPYEAGGSEPLNRPTTYVDKHVPKTFTVGGPQPGDIEAFTGLPKDVTAPDTRFGGTRGGVVGEEGTIFFSPDKKLAESYSDNVVSQHINISNAGTYDVDKLVDDPAFVADMRAAFQKQATRNEYLAQRAETPEGKQLIEEQWQRDLQRMQERKDNNYGLPRYNANITAAIIERARRAGQDVAVIKNMAEGHGKPSDQIVVLNNDVIRKPPVTFDTAEPTIIHENTEEMAMDILTRGYTGPHLYQGVRHPDVGGLPMGSPQRSEYWTTNLDMAKTYAGPDGFVRIASWSDFPPEAKVRGIDPRGVASTFRLGEGGQPGKTLQVPTIAELPSSASESEFLKLQKGMSPEEAYRVAHFNIAEVAEHAWYKAHGIDPELAEAEWKKIQPGIQHEIASDTPADLYHKEYPGADVTKARHEDVFETGPTPEETARGFEILRNAPELRSISAPKLLNIANDLGVIGAPRRIDEGTPQEAAQRAIPAAGPPGEKITMEPNAARDKAGNIRLDQIGINADAKDTLLEAAKANDDFSQARQGNIPLTQIISISDATGIPLATLRENEAGLGRLMHNDAVVRTWLQAFHQATDEIAEQMKKAKLSNDEADFNTLREMKLRLTHMQEQVSGLTAEAGRTLGVFREFYAAKGKAEAITGLLRDNPGNDLDSLKKLADLGSALNPRTQLPRWLNNMREPNFWDKYLFYWVNALISGPITHSLYVGANSALALYDAGPVTLAAGIYGTLRRAVIGGTEGAFAGEAPARLFGLMTGTPEALKAAWTAAKENIQVPLPGEIAKDYNPVINMRPNPIGGKAGVIIGAPSRAATGIHSFFNFLGYRSSIEGQAYRMASSEQIAARPSEDFLNRWRFHANNPSPEIMDKAIEDGYRLTFIEKQGELGRKVNQLANARVNFPFTDGKWQPFKLVMPFTHIPGNIMKQGIEQSPLGPILDHEMRSDLLGKNGVGAHDMAIGRLVMGGAITGMVVNWALNDSITGYGPTDPTERALWLRTHQPYSIKLGGYWVSYNKFGPIGDFVGVVANLAEIGPKVADKQYSEAAGQILKASSHLVLDEVGMQGLANIMDAMENENKAGTYVAKMAASNIPFSSLLRQTASVTDPYTREAKTFVDNMRYTIPYARQDLLPRRDWLGQPVPNPGYATIVRQAPVNTDPLDYEMQRLQIKPGVPEDRIGGVKLSPEMYDMYQEKAGLMTKMMLNAYVNSPGWNQLPDYNRETIIHSVITSARKDAGQALQMANPELILQGIKQQQDYLMGLSHTKRPKEAPVMAPLAPGQIAPPMQGKAMLPVQEGFSLAAFWGYGDSGALPNRA